MVARVRRIFWGLFFAGAATLALADTWPYFSPATGILKGNPATYVTTAAANTDVINLWTGCSSPTTMYLRADGQCIVPPGTGGGTVNSVSMTVPSWLTVTGSPVTSSGTLALASATTLTNNQVLAVSGGALSPQAITTAMLPAIPLASGVSGILGAANGGFGVASPTAHSVLFSEGSSAFNVLTMSADTVLQGSGSAADPVAAAVPNCTGSPNALNYSTSTHTFTCGTISAGTGTVTSVGLSLPSVFSVSGSPVTGAGTLTVNFAGAQTADQGLLTPCGSSGAVALRAICAADISGLGVTWTAAQTFNAAVNMAGSLSYTGSAGVSLTPSAITGSPANLDAQQWMTLSTASNVSGLSFTGTDNRALTFTVSTANHPVIRSGANLDILATNINLTGAVGATASSGISFTANGTAGNPAAQVLGNSTSGSSQGLLIKSGTTSGDFGLSVLNQAGGSVYFKVYGDGGTAAGGASDPGAGNLSVFGTAQANALSSATTILAGGNAPTYNINGTATGAASGVQGLGGNGALFAQRWSSGVASIIVGESPSGTVGSFSALPANTQYARYAFASDTGTQLNVGASIVATSGGSAWSGSNNGSLLTFYTTPNGSTTNTAALILGTDQSATFNGAITESGAGNVTLSGATVISNSLNVVNLLTAQGGLNVTGNVNATGTLQQNSVPVSQLPMTVNTQSGTTYTLVASDCGALLYLTGASPTVTVPSSTLSAGCTVGIIFNGSGTATLSQGSGMTLHLAGGSTTGNRTLALGFQGALTLPTGAVGFVGGSGVS